jgi:hypothetical protein
VRGAQDTYTYAIDSFSADRRAVRGPRDLLEDRALDYLAQRLADQHRGGLTPTYWRARAGGILEEACQQASVACIHRIDRGRGVIVTAEAVESAAVYRVQTFPLFDDDGAPGEQCAGYEHPRLPEAMREAGLRAEAWIRMDSEEVRLERERGPLVGFTVQVTAELIAPLLPGGDPVLPVDALEDGGLYAPHRGCSM